MKKEGLDAAVEQIMSDPKYAQQVYGGAEKALKPYKLRPGEWRLVAWFLRQDVKDSLGNVEGRDVQGLDFSAVRFKFLSRLPAFRKDVIANPSDPTTQ